MMLTSISERIGKVAACNIRNNMGWDNTWKCPLCKKETIYVKRASNGTISHFRHKVEADHESISQSPTHLVAKRDIMEKLKEDNNFKDVEIEKTVGDQIIDVFVEDYSGNKIAVEIQCSIQGEKKFRKRSEKYSKKGYNVLWILHKPSFLSRKTSKDGRVSGVTFRSSIKWLQKHYYGRVYYFDYKDEFRVEPFRLKSASTYKEGFNPETREHFDYTYYYDSIAHKSKGNLPNYGIFTSESNGIDIARFYDKCWWK